MLAHAEASAADWHDVSTSPGCEATPAVERRVGPHVAERVFARVVRAIVIQLGALLLFLGLVWWVSH